MRVRVAPDQVHAAFAQFHGQDVFSESTALVEAGGLPVEMIQASSAPTRTAR